MGPNCYVSPGNYRVSRCFSCLQMLTIVVFTSGGGFTQFHQDGHGTVDSGHVCLTGYNEVVMLRRLPEGHKLQACQMLPQFISSCTKEDMARNILYRLPHEDNRKDCPMWPTKPVIRQWKDAK